MKQDLNYQHGKIQDVDIQEEMKQSFLDYAMSVIVSRALPDVRDGLKPVHRRILYSMYELNMFPDKPFKKSARIVGEVLGKFHPHGDSAVYEAMVRLAQDFSTRYLLVDGQGNFGSIDDDPPAAMRYTEARLSKIAVEMLNDLEFNTVDWMPNFDGTLEEPKVLPSGIPNLLINGVTGIAVGMATSIPPHNLQEVIQALNYLIDNPNCYVEDLLNFIKGPDFPTGGIVLGKKSLKEAYINGKGSITVRGVTNLEENKKGKTSIVVSEIPYQVSKRRLIEQIAELVKDKKLDGIADLRDESDKEGMRIVIELKRDAIPQVVLNNLYKNTLLQTNFSVNLLALVDKQPKVLNLKEILELYLKHRFEVITRRTKFLLNKAEAREHIVQGLLVVQNNIDDVINIIKLSSNPQEAQEKLIIKYGLSQDQTNAILEMQLRRLTSLEKNKLENEHLELISKINDYRDILNRSERIYSIMKNEFAVILEKYSDKRRTKFIADTGELKDIDLIPDEPMAIFMTNQGYIKRVSLEEFTNQQRGGRGKGGLTTREDDFVKHFFVSSNHSYILFFTKKGLVYQINVYDLPESSRQAKGVNIATLINISSEDEITAVIPVNEFAENNYLVMLTRNGIIKKTDLLSYSNIRSSGIIAINLDENDELKWVAQTDGKCNIIIGTKNGYALRFSEEDLRPLGRNTRGVKAITLRENDSIVSFDVVSNDLIPKLEDNEDDEDENENNQEIEDSSPKLLTVTTDGYGKRTPIWKYRLQSRGGLGIKNIKLKSDNSNKVSSVLFVQDNDEIMIVTLKGIVIRQKVSDISVTNRVTKGVKLQRLDEDDEVLNVQLVVNPDEKENSNQNLVLEE
ncbi:MAG: DNA gyrase subunit A [Candidatus Sericytochromatia bacterium]|nr:MAG: DNA gyrase subunit A [Candidatus Sericytochromatia bacterium]